MFLVRSHKLVTIVVFSSICRVSVRMSYSKKFLRIGYLGTTLEKRTQGYGSHLGHFWRKVASASEKNNGALNHNSLKAECQREKWKNIQAEATKTNGQTDGLTH
jgi:hypothetical protein